MYICETVFSGSVWAFIHKPISNILITFIMVVCTCTILYVIYVRSPSNKYKTRPKIIKMWQNYFDKIMRVWKHCNFSWDRGNWIFPKFIAALWSSYLFLIYVFTHLPNITREYILRIRRRPNIFFSIYFIIIYKSWGPGPSGAQKCLAYRRVEFQTHANSRWNSHGGNSLDNLFLYGPWFCFLYV